MNYRKNLTRDGKAFGVDFLKVSPIGGSNAGKGSRARLYPSKAYVDYVCGSGWTPALTYKVAHQLEERDPDSISGVWPISDMRATRMYGLSTRVSGSGVIKFEDVAEWMWEDAHESRLLSYHRITDKNEAFRLIENSTPVNIALEIDSDWYDPPNGEIQVPAAAREIISSHAVAVVGVDREAGRVKFMNSWGENWGNEGYGSFPMIAWDDLVFEAWHLGQIGLYIPTEGFQGPVTRTWKWSRNPASEVYCCEIYDATSHEYLAWSFCVKRDGFLAVDEFFVRPECRGKGYARELAARIKELSQVLKRPVKLVISHADFEANSGLGPSIVSSIFGLRLIQSNEPYAAAFGAEDGPAFVTRDYIPGRPESIWEKLRPRKEPPLKTPKQYTVIYGTNREPNDESDLSKGYSNRRGYQLRTGTCLVELPETHQFGYEGRSFLSRLKPADGMTRRLVGTQYWEWDELVRFAKTFVNGATSEPYNLLFIHGYQNSFDDAAIRAGQLGLDLKVPGATFFYSWPSTESLLGYNADEAAYEYSVDYCLSYVKDILTGFPEVPLHIVAHSMGNRVVLGLFEKLSQEPLLLGKLGQLVFAAADVDADRFRQAVQKIRHLPKRMTSYVARGDGALLLSLGDHWAPRVGLAPPITCVEGVDTILVEGFAASDVAAHAYFTDEEPVLYDMFCLLRHGSTPNNRPKIKEERGQNAASSFWSLSLK